MNLKQLQWQLSDTNDSIIVHNINPSDVHLALLEKGVIPNPFYGENEEKLQWIGKRDWIFSTRFSIAETMLKQQNIQMVFEGLDTYATVFLNGTEILKSDNMFRKWEVNVTWLLRKKDNELQVLFRSPEKINEQKQAQAGYVLPEIRGFTRKAAYQFGWDWGPRFVTMGIWKPAYLIAAHSATINDFFVEQKEVSQQKALLLLRTKIRSFSSQKAVINSYVNDTLKDREEIYLQKGDNNLSIPIDLSNPKLWWPNGMGQQILYTFKQQIVIKGITVAEKELKTGLRAVKLLLKKDSIGKSFTFQINGKRVFAKGANVIPMDNFPSRISNKRYRTLLSDVKAAHMNMLRVWGGGTYENNLFYHLCDSLGIMVWQDFMFADNMVPTDSSFANNVKKETEEQIRRLRNHPSLVLWCGNNEIKEAWNNWGWQQSLHYSPEDSARLWHAYQHIFNGIIPANIQKLDPETPYWPSSPSIGWGHPEAFRNGDVHYWGVWWGKEPFEQYTKKVGRFMSEYGFQGMPSMKSIKQFCPSNERNLSSKTMQVHQKHPFGWQNIRRYMQRDYNIPTRFEDYDYVSQLIQMEGLSKAIEAHRRAKPYCMGTLYWQLNDCWPVTSWSSIDYYGRWKALQYRVVKDYAPYLLSFQKTERQMALWLISDTTCPSKGTLSWQFIDFDGTILEKGKKELAVPADSSWKVMHFANHFLNDSTHIVLVATLTIQNRKSARSLHYFVKPKNLKLPPSHLSYTIQNRAKSAIITLTTDHLAKNVRIGYQGDGRLSNNYFDLLPNETQVIRYSSKKSFVPLKKITLKTLADIQ